MDTIGPHVLIVDDTFVDRLVASRVLKTCNIQGIMSWDFYAFFTITDFYFPLLIIILFCSDNGGGPKASLRFSRCGTSIVYITNSNRNVHNLL
jgi:hypothetical protein